MCCENVSMVYKLLNLVAMGVAHQLTVMKNPKFELSRICNISTVHSHKLYFYP